MTDEMLALANENKRKAGAENVAFLKGEIENIPLPDNSVDVIIYSRTSIPPPDPRSSTVSPGFSCANAVGLPHPSDANTASSGIALV